MAGFIEGEDRHQATLFPEQIDDYIAEDNAVRVIDVFVDEMDLGKIGFKTVPTEIGRPAYNPATMLKLYIYGYLNRIQSSRRLEREAGRNVELMWLLRRLAPDFKTIADFRKDNTTAIKSVCREFVMLCRKLDLFADSIVAIDGSKFKGVNKRSANYTRNKLKYRLKALDESIAKYLGQIDTADRVESSKSKVKIEGLQDKIARLKEKVKSLNKIAQDLEVTDDKQISLTDPDSRSMKAKDGSLVGYNIQSSVDATNHIIIDHDVTNIGNDRSQLSRMAKRAKDVIGADKLDVVADMGYYNSAEIHKCDEAGIDTFMPRPQTSGNKAKGLFDKSDFTYIPESDEYQCPAGETLIWRMNTYDKGKPVNRYWSSNCKDCSLKLQCTTGKNRRISRGAHESSLDALDKRMTDKTDIMILRKSTVEHPFGTIKHWMGSTHFQMKGLQKVGAEMSLHVLAYNLKRVIKIVGTVPLMEAMRA